MRSVFFLSSLSLQFLGVFWWRFRSALNAAPFKRSSDTERDLKFITSSPRRWRETRLLIFGPTSCSPPGDILILQRNKARMHFRRRDLPALVLLFIIKHYLKPAPPLAGSGAKARPPRGVNVHYSAKAIVRHRKICITSRSLRNILNKKPHNYPTVIKSS